MTPDQLYALCGTLLFGLGFWGVMTLPNLLRKVIGLNVMGAGVFLVFIALADRVPGEAPDPVPQAMVLTGLVVSISATALALAMIRRIYRETGHLALASRETDESSSNAG